MRPDQQKFDALEAPLRNLDHIFSKHCEKGWTLLKNNHRHPSRALRRDGNPELSVEVQLCDDWHQLEEGANAKYKLSVNGWCSDTEGVWHLGKVLLTDCDYNELRDCLDSVLHGAVTEVQGWNVAIIQQQGRFQRYYTPNNQ